LKARLLASPGEGIQLLSVHRRSEAIASFVRGLKYREPTLPEERKLMLRSLNDLERYTVSASDGDIGHVINFLLDDMTWAVRYLIVRTNGFFGGKEVLVAPVSFGHIDWSTRRFSLSLTQNKVRSCPDVDFDKPVSRQHEWEYYQYYQYPFYWERGGLSESIAMPELLSITKPKIPLENQPGDIHLRSAKEVCGYHIQGIDGEIGHVDDYIVDDETWVIRYLVIDTNNWWVGNKVLIAPKWSHSISWEEKKVFINMPRDAIKNSPKWNPLASVNREYELRLYDYYGRPLYWDENHP
jgi:sporulation protein YlmC with PRC-barrel domain